MKERANQKRKAAPQETKKRSGTFDKALAEYEKGIRQVHKRAWDEARAHFKEVLESHAEELEICERARSYLRIVEEQISPRKPRPKTADDHYLLGVLEHNGGEWKNAIHEFEKALQMGPGDERVLYALAASHARAGNEKDALASLRKAIDRSRDNAARAARDEDFEALDADPEFLELTEPVGSGRA
jgi:tetratricopeptide (TPR) repeat protein